MNLVKHAERELDNIGMVGSNVEEAIMRKHILKVIEEFNMTGHTKLTRHWYIDIITKLMKGEPLTPLTGEDNEWKQIKTSDGIVYENIRCDHVFKKDGIAWNQEGIVYWKWYTDIETGCKMKSFHIIPSSMVNVEFPHTPATEYKELT